MYDADDNDAVTVTLWASDEEADEAAADLRPLAMSAFRGRSIRAAGDKEVRVPLCGA